jgi:hypothetical protein
MGVKSALGRLNVLETARNFGHNQLPDWCKRKVTDRNFRYLGTRIMQAYSGFDSDSESRDKNEEIIPVNHLTPTVCNDPSEPATTISTNKRTFFAPTGADAYPLARTVYEGLCVSDRDRTGVVQSVQRPYFGLPTGEQWIDSLQRLKFFCARQSRPALESTHPRIQKVSELFPPEVKRLGHEAGDCLAFRKQQSYISPYSYVFLCICNN